ncbi:hypothetical protein [Qipengyuania sp. ASV99]|uniref:hypothetical protein n=1 Tax=Qipengyuania sp. ASV99 TaxID=3399681 RepID=UPI003A4C71F5
MTVIAQSSPRAHSSQAWRMLLIGCSGIALCAPASANDVIFSNAASQPETGQRTSQTSGVTQVALTGGGTASFVDAADYTLNADGSIDLHKGTVTVAAGATRDTVVRMPEGLEGRVIGGVRRGGAANVEGGGSSARFTVGDDRSASGHALTGSVRVGRAGGRIRDFRDGAQWRASTGGGPRRTVANDPVSQPDRDTAAVSEPVVAAIGGDAGPVGAALNGIPVTLGDGLAAAGASSDIIAAGRRVELAAANPALDTFPSGDLALLVAAAAQLETSYGGRPFNAAQADVIRAYLRFLANGGSGAQFLTAYSGFVLDYLDLIRAGGVPSGFASGAANAADIDAYLSFIARTGAITDLAARDRALADAYLAFLASGGNRDLFAASFTELTSAYFAFVRARGVPSQFTGASQDALAQSIAFLSQSGLAVQLSAADQALIAAFLENGGIAFASQYRSALGDYFAFLASGRRPSEYQTLDQATLRAYLETLSDTGLFETVLADQAEFYRDYLTFLRAGGNVDGFAGLPANIFAGYAVQLDAYFAFLAAGNLPSQFDAADIAQLQAFIVELQAAGALDSFLAGNRASFFADFSQFVAAGGDFDAFAGLNANIFAGYALDLRAYFDFLLAGGVPSSYAVLDQATIQQYLAALEAAGATGAFLDDLAAFYQAYFTFVVGGGNPDNFAQLPVPPDFPAFAAALNAYAAFLSANGLPSDYTEADIAQLQAFFNSVLQSGQLNTLLGDNAALLNAYFVFVGNGGAIDGFAGLPVFADYVVQLNAYFAFLDAGGFPADYALLDQATLNAYLAALANAQGGLAGFGNLNDFFADYAAFVLSGGNPVNFAGLPVYADFVAALNAYFDFLAAGNLPSDYTVLDAATLEAYLAALAALQGGLAGFAELNAFFIDYFAFLQGGGNPDMFAGLPGNNGGGTGGNPDIPAMLTGYAGGFDAVEPLIGFVLGGGLNAGLLSGGEGLGFKAGDLVLDEDGGLQSYVRLPSTGQTRTKGSTEVVDIFGNSDALIGRWTNGTISIPNTFTFNQNQGLHYLLTRPVAPDFALPASGRLDYYQTAATRPTITDGSVAPGTFDASLAILLGAEIKLGLEGSITMPTGANPYVFSFSTTGGIEDPSQSTTIIGLSTLGTFSAFVAASDNGGTCNSIDTCGLSLTAGFAGDMNTIGLTYRAVREGIGQNLAGAAIFQSGPERTSGGVGTGGPVVGTVANFGTSGLVIAALSYGEAGFTRTSRTNGTDVSPQGVLNSIGPFSRGTAVGDQIIGDEYGIIGRWVDGTANLVNGTYAATANDAVHWAIANPTSSDFNLRGTITYDLLGATTPTYSDGRTAPGTFDGSLVINWQSQTLLAMQFDATVTMPDITYNWNFQSPNFLPRRQGVFESFATASDTRCNGNACQAAVSYNVGGAQLGERWAINYNISVGADQLDIGGSALFGAPGTYDPSAFGQTPTTGTAGNAVENQLIAYAGADVGIDMREKAEVTYNSAGAPVGYVSRINDFTAENERPNIGTATAMEAGSRGDGLIGWTRWADGQGGGRYFADTDGFTLPANGGFHIVAVDPATEHPTSGEITYEFAGATNPTVKDASLTPGTFNGTMAIAFGAAPTADFNFTVGIGGSSYNFGASDRPIETSGNFANQFGANSMAVSGTGSVCPTGACQANMRGALGGVGATAVGVSYNFAEAANENLRTYGAAAFVAPGVGASGTSGADTTAAIAPGIAPISGFDWSRWSGGGQAGGQSAAFATPLALGQLPAGLAGAEGREPGFQLAQREAAMRDAERLMGGMISFGSDAVAPR